MGFFELFLLAIGLSMDAFAVSICKGLALPRVQLRSLLIVGAWFGGFQALMPLLGWALGSQFQTVIASVDHWIAFILLGTIGFNMVRESRSREEDALTQRRQRSVFQTSNRFPPGGAGPVPF